MAADLKISKLLDFYSELLSHKQKRIIEQYYNEDLSLSEIAENEGITRQGVSESIKRAEQNLCEFENKLHFIEISDKIKSAANKVTKKDDNQVSELLDLLNELL